MLPVVAGPARTATAVALNTVCLVACSLLLCGFVGWPFAIVAVPAGIWFLAETLSLHRHPERARAWRTFKLSGLYLLLLLVGLVVSPLG
jgi:protoheme IX farnesyltransferase